MDDRPNDHDHRALSHDLPLHIGGTVEPGPEVWAVSMDDSDETSVCGGAVIDMADGNPYPDEVVITDPAGRFGVHVPSPDDAQCLTAIGEAMATVGE